MIRSKTKSEDVKQFFAPDPHVYIQDLEYVNKKLRVDLSEDQPTTVVH